MLDNSMIVRAGTDTLNKLSYIKIKMSIKTSSPKQMAIKSNMTIDFMGGNV